MENNNLELNLFDDISLIDGNNLVESTNIGCISKNQKCYIFVNWSGVLRKGFNPIDGFKKIIECNSENIANSVLEAVPKAYMRNIYVIPCLSPLNSKIQNQLCFNNWLRTLDIKYSTTSLILYRLLENPWK